MSEQPSTTTDAGQWPEQNASMDSSAHIQLPIASNVVWSTTSDKRFSSVRTSPWLNLNECMNFIATCAGMKKLDYTGMRCLLERISSNMTPEQLPFVLNGYADLLQNILHVIPISDALVNGHSLIDSYTGVSGVDGQDKYQWIAIVLHDTTNNLFASLYIHANNFPQTFFHHTMDSTKIVDIFDFIEKLNLKDRQSTTDTVDDDNISVGDFISTSDFDAQLLSKIDTEKVTVVSVKKNIITRLERALYSARKLGPKLDDISLEEMLQQLVVVDFDDPSENEQIETIQNELQSVLKCLPTITVISQEEVVDNGLTMEVEEDVKYNAPRILIEPTRYQRNRMFTDLVAGGSPLIQAGDEDAPQQSYVEIEVPPRDGVQLYVRVSVDTVAKVKHPFKAVVPEKPSFGEPLIGVVDEKNCLTCDQNDYDPQLECTYLQVTDAERVIGTKEILAHLLSWKQKGVDIQKRIKAEKLRLCKLQLSFCVRCGPGRYRTVSPSTHSSVIEDGDRPLVITLSGSQPPVLSEKGGETLDLLLNYKCRKNDLYVLCNNRQPRKENWSINKKVISIISPAKTTKDKNFHVKISHEEYDDKNEQMRQRIVYERTFRYKTRSGKKR